MLVAWIVMGVLLAFYHAGWVRYFGVGREYALLGATRLSKRTTKSQ